ncbi:MAG: carbohydrate ABC transporter permease [Anaerocolumna sp.]
MADMAYQTQKEKPLHKQSKLPSFILFIITVLLAVLFLVPIFFAFISAFKSNGEILKNPMALPSSLFLQNFKDLFEQSDFLGAIKNSVILTVASEILIVCIVPMAAYGIERRANRTTAVIYTYFLAGMMIPFQLYMFPLFKEMKILGIYGNLIGPILSYIAGSVAFGSLMYCSFLKGIPLEIEEAARIDGCNPFQVFFKVTFPLLSPCTASMVVLNGLGIWNDFLMPYLVLPSGKAKTITAEVYSFVGQYSARWDVVFAGTVISIIPALIIFTCLQKYFVKGITAGAAKG